MVILISALPEPLVTDIENNLMIIFKEAILSGNITRNGISVIKLLFELIFIIIGRFYTILVKCQRPIEYRD